jgi:hypothetical protein
MVEAETTAPEADLTVKKSKHRSPNYPAIGLEKALERAQAIKEQAGKHPMPVGVAHKAWGYRTGAGDQQVAALKSYGLIEVLGAKDKRQLQLTDAAWRILGNAPDRAELLKSAALNPDIHKQVWEKYGGELPADSIIREYLIWERKFNDAFVDSFIAQLRGTIAYANLGLSDKVAAEPIVVQEKGGKPVNTATNTPTPEFAPPTGYKEFPVYLTNRQRGILHVPVEMTHKDYELLKQQIDNHMAVILVTSVVDPEPEEN